MAAATKLFREYKLGLNTIGNKTHRKSGKTSPRRQTRGINMGLSPDYQDYLQSRDPFDQSERERRHLSMFYYFAQIDRRSLEKSKLHARPISAAPRVGHKRRRAEEGTRSSASSGDSNGDSDDSNPERCLQTYDQAQFASLLCISKKTIQNLYSKSPHLLPQAIRIPGARGPRWTQQAIHEWLNNRPEHSPKPVPGVRKRKVGRPRIATALGGKGGASC